MADSPSKKQRPCACLLHLYGRQQAERHFLSGVCFGVFGTEPHRQGALKFNVGNMDTQNFDESDDALFKPGNPIRLDTGGTDNEDTLFEGNIIGVRILTGKDFCSYILVECRDNVYPVTQRRKKRIFEHEKDSDIIKDVLKNYGSVEVDVTGYQHFALVHLNLHLTNFVETLYSASARKRKKP